MTLLTRPSFAFAAILASLAPLSMQAADKVNLTQKVSSITSSVETEGNAATLVADGTVAGQSYWSSWQGKEHYGEYSYIEFRWPKDCQITNSRIFWATAGDSIAAPTDAYLAVFDGKDWVKTHTIEAPNSRNISATKDTLETRRLRLYMKSDAACGVYEVYLYGYELECEAATLTDEQTSIVMRDGESYTLAPQLTLPNGEEEVGLWTWTLPDGSTTTGQTVVAKEAGSYTVTYERACGTTTTLTYNLYTKENLSYSWPSYDPTISYDFRESEEYTKITTPTKFLPENNGQVGYMADGWWAVAWGNKTSHYVTETAKKNLLEKMNTDFAYFREEMGWPPDKRARNGYYSTVYVYGSGLNSDAADSTALGGWQSATWYNDSSWPMVYISYYPIACFDPKFTYDKYQSKNVNDAVAQQNACVHEGIHAIFADLDGCKNSAWYHEAGNTWLQAQAEVKKTGIEPTSMGYLSAGNMIAPFMPIECYSGWLLDGSFGGPSAEGVNMYNGSQQICTWRNLLGGVQYGELFPHFLAEILGEGSIPWIWRNCKSRVLEGIGSALGDEQMRRLIVEYRSRQALIDVGTWSTACRNLIENNWLVNIKQEWSPYSQAVDVWKACPYNNMYACEGDSADWWKPEARTLPGWSGANQIPLHVNAQKGNIISIHFKPLGENMVCQLAYRSKRGKKVYSRPVYGEGDVYLALNDLPANNVVFAIVCNTDYIYKGEETRKAKYDYRLKMGENVYQPAKAQLKWYQYSQNIKDDTFSGIDAPEAVEQASTFAIVPSKAVVKAGETIDLSIHAASSLQVPVRLYASNGALVEATSLLRDGAFTIPAGLSSGVYVLTAASGSEKASVKIIVRE